MPCASTGCGGSFIGVPSVLVISQPQGSPLTLPATSLPVKTFATPGIASARLVSIERIVACACGERTNTAWRWFARLMSSVYWPLPVRKR